MSTMRVVAYAIAGGILGAIAGSLLPGIEIGLAAVIGAALGAACSAPAFRGRSIHPAASEAEASERKTLQLREERLDIKKERIRTGDVAIRKEVVEEIRSVEVPVRREDVVIERTTAASDDAGGAATETIRIPVKEERIDIVKTPVDLEEVSVYTRPVEDMTEIDAAVKRERLRIERSGQADAFREPGEEPRA